MGPIQAELKEIYIHLPGDGDDSWHPTMGLEIAPMLFKILTVEGYDPDSEKWEFRPGSIVKCELREIDGSEVLAAVSEADLA